LPVRAVIGTADACKFVRLVVLGRFENAALGFILLPVDALGVDP
jgi:hypothetical protein